MSGVFITFEGVDGAGKTTQLTRFLEHLAREGRDVVPTREPGGDFVAEKIRQLLLDPENTDMDPVTEAYLYAASRAQHVRKVVAPALKAGKTVVCDRYVDSSAAYQGEARDLGINRVLEINRDAMGGVLPNWTVLLLISPEDARERIKARGESPDRLEGEGLLFQKKVYHGFLEMARRDPERIFTVDASKTPDEIEEVIWNEFKARGL